MILYWGTKAAPKESLYYGLVQAWTTLAIEIYDEGDPTVVSVGDTYDCATILRCCNNDNTLEKQAIVLSLVGHRLECCNVDIVLVE